MPSRLGWVGYFLLDKNKSISKKSLGFALVFANMPFARLFTAAFQSGDEVYGLGLLTENWDLSWAFGFITIAIITFPPLYRAYKTIGNKRKIAWFLLFFIAPMIVSFLIVLGLLNTLLANGVLSNTGILGSPIIINVWTAFILIVFFLLRKNIYTLFKNPQE